MGSVEGANMIPTCIFTVKSPTDTYRLQHILQHRDKIINSRKERIDFEALEEKVVSTHNSALITL